MSYCIQALSHRWSYIWAHKHYTMSDLGNHLNPNWILQRKNFKTLFKIKLKALLIFGGKKEHLTTSANQLMYGILSNTKH